MGERFLEVGACCVQVCPGGVCEDMFLITGIFTCVFVGPEFTYCYCVSSIGNWIVMGFALLKLGGVGGEGYLLLFFFRVSGYRKSIAGNT